METINEKEIVVGKFSKVNIPCIIALLLSAFGFINLMMVAEYGVTDEVALFLLMGIIPLVFAVIFFVWMSNCAITVTDKRVYGKAAFGRRVDLPLDKVSAVGSGIFNSLSVSTSSGKIAFLLMKNKNEVFEGISSILVARQEGKNTVNINSHSDADELKKYKELLDMGVITQEEFDAKKKELLGL